MLEPGMHNLGRFVWFDLMTTDTSAAQSFYDATLGWKTVPWEGESDKPYTMFAVGERPIGGLLELPDAVRAMNVPPHWKAYAKVADIGIALQEVEKLGGAIHKAAWTITSVGTVAIVADPQGAVFALFQPEEDRPPNDESQPGFIGWNELNTTDHESAWTFYSALLNWTKTDSVDMGPELGKYAMFKHEAGERSIGGMCNAATQQPPHWLHYTNVASIDDTVASIKANGGKVLSGPLSVPGGRVARCQDPQGAAFAIHERVK